MVYITEINIEIEFVSNFYKQFKIREEYLETRIKKKIHLFLFEEYYVCRILT